MDTEQPESSKDEVEPHVDVKLKEEADKSKNESETTLRNDRSKEDEDRNEDELRKLSQSSKETSLIEESSLKRIYSGTLSPRQKSVKWDRKVCGDTTYVCKGTYEAIL